nr:selenide, water dikinase SelD [Actinomycetota bacterium]
RTGPSIRGARHEAPTRLSERSLKVARLSAKRNTNRRFCVDGGTTSRAPFPQHGAATIELQTPQVKLTDLASCGGCAAKYSAARLEELLRGFVPVDSEDLLVGLAPADDAAVYRLDEERALIFTLDFFPPIVDDPGDFGAIAATNALNDVFAMGGSPLLALSIAAFPESLPTEMLAAIFAAADAQVRAAGGLLAGGHTIRDEEPKYGLAVVGTVHPEGLWPKSGARAGDALFITKPLGTGLTMTGYKRGDAGTQQLERAVRWMRTLNKDAADALRSFEPNAVTDVTGFGLFGHAHEMADRSGVRILLESERFPAIDGALDLARSGIRTSGDPRNRDFAGPHVELGGVSETLAALGFDPQTAGGLLISLPAERGPVLEAEFASRRLFLRRIGGVEEGTGVVVR